MEIEHDKKMTRTKKRPLPTGRISPFHAAVQAAAAGAIGTATLFYANNALTAGLGAANILLYTCVYTPLKVFYLLSSSFLHFA
jgi:protoheme IX farnesyltransferase